uniref:Large ribosomal subunit protein uL4c n=1 Tax=Pyropia perforata TaxID=182771 RepID=A0A023I7I0_PYRPE|nr:50S ribosomal protein L3 [Neoporphyra perforata]AGV01102.1 50S ribosomal protein L3 [Neoporphyra perforata]AHB35089.1 50S ribosomal protein L3 [Neoporphyra perforata]AHB35298.1 50S ribosomal protein L3 [Neoporphyra perforata]AIA19460.1 50S ribosomal protein L3 [Neoporphyra perforata]AIA19669.1 50S ribosomal protein L3 [Neoporphyra perforata]
MTVKTQLNYQVYNWEGQISGSADLNLKVSQDSGMYLVHRALVKQSNQKRQGSANTKTRSEVRGGGRKPWRQKGTGRARAGSIRSPLWRGGGVIFGPKPRSFAKKMNKKERQLALRTALNNKSVNTLIVENFNSHFQQPKTKMFMEAIQRWNLDLSKKVLVVVDGKDPNVYLSVRNLHNVEIISADTLNIMALLAAHKIIITVDALSKIQEVYNG